MYLFTYTGNQILATSVGTVYVVNITCPDGWVKAMNNCYYFNTQDQVTWSEARTECNIRNSDLLFIANSEEKVSYKGFVWGPCFVV